MSCEILRTCTALFSITAALSLATGSLAGSHAAAQLPPRQAPKAPREAAPIDLTGNWVSVVTEDWRWRMVTPRKGDYSSMPLTEEGRKVADTWDLAKDAASGNQCRAFGVAAIMRMPGRLRISWENDTTLRIDADAGTQTRLLQFGESQKPVADPTWQGHSVAAWETRATGGPGGGGDGGGQANAGGGQALEVQQRPQGGSLKVVTTHMRPGYLRKNGVPYSENALVTEYFDRHAAYSVEWFTVTTIVEDPRYLNQPFITSSHFKREPDGSKWNPTPCEIAPPAK
jgi:hypothetical protein